jgi:hypothetical protein
MDKFFNTFCFFFIYKEIIEEILEIFHFSSVNSTNFVNVVGKFS